MPFSLKKGMKTTIYGLREPSVRGQFDRVKNRLIGDFLGFYAESATNWPAALRPRVYPRRLVRRGQIPVGKMF
jgi:hypothetical protein